MILDEIYKGEGQQIPFRIGQPHDPSHDMTSEIRLPDEQEEMTPKKETPCIPSKHYEPNIPYPRRRTETVKDKEYEKMKNIIRDTQLRLPFVDAVKMIPTLKNI